MYISAYICLGSSEGKIEVKANMECYEWWVEDRGEDEQTGKMSF